MFGFGNQKKPKRKLRSNKERNAKLRRRRAPEAWRERKSGKKTKGIRINFRSSLHK